MYENLKLGQYIEVIDLSLSRKNGYPNALNSYPVVLNLQVTEIIKKDNLFLLFLRLDDGDEVELGFSIDDGAFMGFYSENCYNPDSYVRVHIHTFDDELEIDEDDRYCLKHNLHNINLKSVTASDEVSNAIYNLLYAFNKAEEVRRIEAETMAHEIALLRKELNDFKQKIITPPPPSYSPKIGITFTEGETYQCD